LNEYFKPSTLGEKVDDLEKTLQEARERIAALHVVQEVSQSLTSELHLKPLLGKILASAVQVMSASAGSLLLLDELTDELVFTILEGGGGESLLGTRMAKDKGIAGWVVTHRQPIIVDDVHQDNRYYQAIANTISFHISSLICVPMVTRNKLIGVLELMHSETGRYFNKFDQQLLTTFASQSAIAIENARLHENLIAERDHLIVVEDEIRKRLARDLHDGPTQLLASIIMSLSFTKQLIKRAPDMVLGEIDQTVEVAERALKQLRTLLFDLRPVILETQGLIPALEIYAQRINEVEDFKIILVIENQFERLSPKAEVSIFAVIQEAINNAKKHARASEIRLIFQIDQATDTMAVTTKDDGVGFDVHAVQKRYEERGSLGMINSQERADAINGTFMISSEAGKGTQVKLSFPYTENLLKHQKDK